MGIELPEGLNFRPMIQGDVTEVLAIIAQVDKEDADAARETYRRGLDYHYVITHEEQVVGVTGLAFADGTDNSWWLSWTYVDQAYHGGGICALMLDGALEELREMEARKVFVNVSESGDRQSSRLYEEANQAYKDVGFVEESRYRDYYEAHESRITLGLHLAPNFNKAHATPHYQLGVPTDWDEIPETEDAYYIDWDFEGESNGIGSWKSVIDKIKKEKGRVVFVGVAQDAAAVQKTLRELGFTEVGRLIDFYRDGLDDVHFRYDLL